MRGELKAQISFCFLPRSPRKTLEVRVSRSLTLIDGARHSRGVNRGLRILRVENLLCIARARM